MSIRRVTLIVAASAMVIVLFAGAACAQGSRTPMPSRGWIVADALGYGTLGFVVGAATGAVLTSGEDCGFGPCAEPVLMALGGGLLGMAGGGALGINARRSAAAGVPISSGHSAAMKIGGALGGATLGALISLTMINGDGSGTRIGSDEATFFSLTGAGLVTGIWFVGSHGRELDRLTVTPSVGAKRYGLNAQLNF